MCILQSHVASCCVPQSCFAVAKIFSRSLEPKAQPRKANAQQPALLKPRRTPLRELGAGPIERFAKVSLANYRRATLTSRGKQKPGLASRGQQRSATLSRGQQRPRKISKSQQASRRERRPAEASRDQQRSLEASRGQQGPASELGQQRVAKARKGGRGEEEGGQQTDKFNNPNLQGGEQTKNNNQQQSTSNNKHDKEQTTNKQQSTITYFELYPHPACLSKTF